MSVLPHKFLEAWVMSLQSLFQVLVPGCSVRPTVKSTELIAQEDCRELGLFKKILISAYQVPCLAGARITQCLGTHVIPTCAWRQAICISLSRDLRSRLKLLTITFLRTKTTPLAIANPGESSILGEKLGCDTHSKLFLPIPFSSKPRL